MRRTFAARPPRSPATSSAQYPGALGVGVSVLLRKAEVSEAALAILVENEPRDLAAADVEQIGCFRSYIPELHATRLATSNHVQQHEHALVVEVPIPLHFSAVLLPRAEKSAPGLRHSGQLLPAARREASVHHEFDLGMRPIDRTEVAAAPRLVDRSDQVHVLLRHRPRSIPEAQESA